MGILIVKLACLRNHPLEGQHPYSWEINTEILSTEAVQGLDWTFYLYINISMGIAP